MLTSTATEGFLTALVCLANYDRDSNTGFDIRSNSDKILFPDEIEIASCPTAELDNMELNLFLVNASYNQYIQKIFEIEKNLKEAQNKVNQIQKKSSKPIVSCMGQPSGVPSTKSSSFGNLVVFCEHNQGMYGGNWLLIANRDEGAQEFYGTWADYKGGFGYMNKEFFFGLEKLHILTSSYIHELLVYLETRTGEKAYAHYDAFSIGSENEQYRLKLLGNYSGKAGDALRYHSGQKFTTRDRDNDQHPTQNCARVHAGAWWYKDCMESNLFGVFQTWGEKDIKFSKGILWKGFLDGPLGSIKIVKMYIRPKEM